MGRSGKILPTARNHLKYGLYIWLYMYDHYISSILQLYQPLYGAVDPPRSPSPPGHLQMKAPELGQVQVAGQHGGRCWRHVAKTWCVIEISSIYLYYVIYRILYIYIYICECKIINIYMCVCVCVRVYVCHILSYLYICIYVYIYI